MKKLTAYWIAPISGELMLLNEKLRAFSHANKLIVVAILSAFAAMFQSAGIVPIAGYLISFLATAPIIITVLFSLGHGILSFILTILLLLVLQPSELIIFPFTTGLLGLAIGTGFLYFQRRIVVIAFSAFWLCAGIASILTDYR